MKSFVCKSLLPVVVVALGVLPHAGAQAQGNAQFKPAVVVSLANVGEQFSDATFFLKAAGMEFFAGFLAPVSEQAGAIIDKNKPIGGFLTLSADGERQFRAFLPITDFDKFMEAIDQFVEEKSDVGDGVTRLVMADGEEVFVKQAHGWTFVTRLSKDNLADLPENPVALLGGLEKKYNVAAQVHANNIPDELKDLAVDFLKSAMEQASAQLEDQEPGLRQLNGGMYGKMATEQVQALVRGTEQVTVGWALDANDKSTYIDFTLTAVEGSDLAKQLELNKGAKSEYAGFLMPDSAANLNFISRIAQSDIEATAQMMDQYRKAVISELEKDDSLSDEELDVTRDMVGAFFQVLSDTIKTGKLDGGATLLLANESATFVAGGHVANAKALEGPLRKLINVAKNEPHFPKVTFDADKHGDVTFHRLDIPVPANNPEARQIFGSSLQVYVGIGDKSVYFALGNDCMATIRKVMDASGGPVTGDAPQGQLTVSLAPIMKFAAAVSGDPKAQDFARKFKEGATNDKIRITSRSIERGATSQIKFDDGVFPLFGELMRNATPAFGGGGGF